MTVIPCETCSGRGWIEEHIVNDEFEFYGVALHECVQCPQQLPCGSCGGSGEVEGGDVKTNYICLTCRECDKNDLTHPGVLHLPGTCDCRCRK